MPDGRDGAAAETAEEERRPGGSRPSPTSSPGSPTAPDRETAVDGTTDPAAAPPRIVRDGDVLRFSGALTGMTAGPAWRGAVRDARGARVLDLSGLETLDTGGAALVLASRTAAGEGVRIEGASRPVAAVLGGRTGRTRRRHRGRPSRRSGPSAPSGPGRSAARRECRTA